MATMAIAFTELKPVGEWDSETLDQVIENWSSSPRRVYAMTPFSVLMLDRY